MYFFKKLMNLKIKFIINLKKKKLKIIYFFKQMK